MLRIEPHQMALFRGEATRRFEERMTAHLRQRFPERTTSLPDERIVMAVREGRLRAESYEIVLEDDIRRFLEYFVTYGTQLDTADDARWISDILRRADLSGTQKMDVIDSRELRRARGWP